MTIALATLTRNTARVATTVILTLVPAYLGMVALAVARELWLRAPLDWTVLRQDPLDPHNATVGLMYVGFLLLELVAHGWNNSPLRRILFGDRRSDRSDLFYIIADATGLMKLLIVVMTCGVSAAFEAAIDAGNMRLAADLPLWAAVPLLYVSVDFATYWGHRFMHSPLMWPLHAIHHAAEDMTVLTSSRHHPFDNFFGSVWFLLPAGLLGFSPDAMGWAILFLTAHSFLLHSSLPFPVWLERYVVAGPRAHRIHHAADPACYDCNFGLFVIWDRMFGTYRMQGDVTGLATGVADQRYETGRPFHDMLEVTRIWLDGLREVFPAPIGESVSRSRIVSP